MNVPLLDLKAQYQTIKPEVDRAVQEVFESQYFILGPTVERCEKNLAEYCRSAHAVGVSSGSDALLLALMCEGIGPGDEVLTTPYTFFATVGAIVRTGAKPVFCDIDPVTFNLDVRQVEARITPAVRVIIPVHLYGQMADMDPLMEIAKRHHLLVIEDAAQAIGSEYHGRRAGSIGDYGCFSFFPSKNLGGAGDGGLVTTQDAARAEKLRHFRNHGMNPRYYHQYVGGNFRLDALQAAVVDVKRPYLDGWSAGRQHNARRYDRLFAEAGLSPDVVRTPQHPHKTEGEAPDGMRHIFNQYVIRVPQRDELKAFLTENHIGCDIYYPVPLHLQACFADLGGQVGDFPHSEQAAAETLALPIYPELSDQQAQAVVNVIARFFNR
ncbi:MAG: DegT/DnrJ/EryC1/StrS family aminotransferase [Kiritimatiellae bacterium]|nr:DegT/DnrJ/EryC1/StrS family aminotransferase [Kiritimatiellia bacterium]